jgi:hypothetical protein
LPRSGGQVRRRFRGRPARGRTHRQSADFCCPTASRAALNGAAVLRSPRSNRTRRDGRRPADRVTARPWRVVPHLGNLRPNVHRVDSPPCAEHPARCAAVACSVFGATVKSASRSDLSILRPGLFHVRLSQSAHIPPAGSVARPTQPGSHPVQFGSNCRSHRGEVSYVVLCCRGKMRGFWAAVQGKVSTRCVRPGPHRAAEDT